MTTSFLIDINGFNDVTTFTIKSELSMFLKNTKFFNKGLYISIINLFFNE